nr:acyl carrier protein [Burkholderia singularis]
MSLKTIEPQMPDPANIDSSSIQQWLTERIARYLQISPEDIGASTPLDTIGLDSVYALALCGEIEETLHCVVEPTIAWDFPTVAEIAQELCNRLMADGADVMASEK